MTYDKDAIIGRDDEPTIEIPADPKRIATFIMSLLGKPQKIGSARVAKFVLEKTFFLRIVSMIRQKTESQSPGALVSERYEIGYESGHKEILSDMKLFEALDIQKKRISNRMSIRLEFIVAFGGSGQPEKQSVELNFFSHIPLYSSLFSFLPFDNENQGKVGLFSYEIETTNRTWAEDLESLIREVFEKEIEEHKESSVIKFLRNLINSMYFVLFMPIVSSIISFVLYFRTLPYFFPGWNRRVEAYLSGNIHSSGADVEGLRLVLMHLSSNYGYAYFIVILVAVVTLLFLLFGSINEYLKSFSKSFIILNDYTKKRYEKDIENNAKNRKLYGATIVIVISAFFSAFVSAYIFPP